MTDDLITWDLQHFWHPFTQMKEYGARPPVIITNAAGVYLYDQAGRRYLDGISSWWVNLVGHRHARLDEALKRQIDRFAHVSTATLTHEPAITLARRLVDVAPAGLNRVFYSDNGSTAVETALKMAFQAWQNRGEKNRTHFVGLQHAYHGDTIGAVSVGDVPVYHQLFKPLLFFTHRIPSPATHLAPVGVSSEQHEDASVCALEQLFAQHGQSIAGFILEPLVQAAAGMYVYPASYLRRVRTICDAYGIPLIADEVAVGFGRTGTLFACEQAGISPDVMCISKALTGGYMPMGITLANDSLFEAFYADYRDQKTFFHGHSYTGNPLGCALGIEVLSLFKEGLLTTLPDRIVALQAGFASLQDLPWVLHYRGIGMIAAVDLLRNPAQRIPFDSDERIGYRICQKALEYGLYLRPLGDTLYLLPPLTITADEIRWCIQIIRTSILEILDR